LQEPAVVGEAGQRRHIAGGDVAARRKRSRQRKSVHDDIFPLADLKSPIDGLRRLQIGRDQGEIVLFIPRQNLGPTSTLSPFAGSRGLRNALIRCNIIFALRFFENCVVLNYFRFLLSRLTHQIIGGC
jgi:hypothetical protein